jgi:hypothetical protein
MSADVASASAEWSHIRRADAARAEIQRLLRSLDGVRAALAYELDAVGSGASASASTHTEEATEGPAARPWASAVGGRHRAPPGPPPPRPLQRAFGARVRLEE